MTGNDDVASNKNVRQLWDCVRGLERQLGCKTMEAEILREALERHGQNIDLACRVAKG